MTPEELNRKIDFIVESQARLAAAQEHDRQDRLEFQEWSKQMTAQVIRLQDHQSQRMDRLDKFYAEWSRQNRDFQTQVIDFQIQSLDFQRESIELQKRSHHLLNLILDRLGPAPPSLG